MAKPATLQKSPSLVFDRKRLARSLKSHINIVMFSDYDRTRSYRFSAIWGALAVVAIAVALAWAITATAVLYSVMIDLRISQRSVSRALGIVFEYQMKVDDLLEKNLDRPAGSTYVKKVITPLPDQKDAGDTEKSSAQVAEGSTVVSVTNPRFSIEDQRLDFTMDITNALTDKRIDGYLVAVLSLVTEEGKNISIGAPTLVQLDEQGSPKDLKKGFHFSIRRFKEKQFSFDLPKGVKQENLKSMTVFSHEESVAQPKKFVFKIKL